MSDTEHKVLLHYSKECVEVEIIENGEQIEVFSDTPHSDGEPKCADLSVGLQFSGYEVVKNDSERKKH